jgi:hypothetical protein
MDTKLIEDPLPPIADPAHLMLEINISKRLPAMIAHGKARF